MTILRIRTFVSRYPSRVGPFDIHNLNLADYPDKSATAKKRWRAGRHLGRERGPDVRTFTA